MGLRVCSEPDCHELVTKGKCPECMRAVDTRRGTRQSRGYDVAYDKGRRTEARHVASGRATCWACNTRISPLEAWHYGHCEDDRSTIHGAEHAACNIGHRGKACPHASHR